MRFTKLLIVFGAMGSGCAVEVDDAESTDVGAVQETLMARDWDCRHLVDDREWVEHNSPFNPYAGYFYVSCIPQ